ncbi:MAG: pilus assembly protein [Planctomycetales bacterium]|nr:pilus assembly protein [Planctomycetales bacterium]
MTAHHFSSVYWQRRDRRAPISRRRLRRKGAGVLELAVVLPLFLAMTFGIMDYGWLFFARNTMQHAARRAVRAMAVQEMTAVEGEAVAQATLDASLSNYNFTINITNTADPIITCDISIPASDIGLTGFTTLPGNNMEVSVEMAREAL